MMFECFVVLSVIVDNDDNESDGITTEKKSFEREKETYYSNLLLLFAGAPVDSALSLLVIVLAKWRRPFQHFS